jgi:hypothetical protein
MVFNRRTDVFDALDTSSRLHAGVTLIATYGSTYVQYCTKECWTEGVLLAIASGWGQELYKTLNDQKQKKVEKGFQPTDACTFVYRSYMEP